MAKEFSKGTAFLFQKNKSYKWGEENVQNRSIDEGEERYIEEKEA